MRIIMQTFRTEYGVDLGFGSLTIVQLDSRLYTKLAFRMRAL